LFSINLIFLATDPENFVDYCEKKEHQGLIFAMLVMLRRLKLMLVCWNLYQRAWVVGS